MTEYRYSERGVIRQGDIFRARGGSTYRGKRVGPRGRFKAISFETRRGRVFILAVQVDKHDLPQSGTLLLYVQGKPFRRPELPDEWVIRPYKVSKCR